MVEIKGRDKGIRNLIWIVAIVQARWLLHRLIFTEILYNTTINTPNSIILQI